MDDKIFLTWIVVHWFWRDH